MEIKLNSQEGPIREPNGHTIHKSFIDGTNFNKIQDSISKTQDFQ